MIGMMLNGVLGGSTLSTYKALQYAHLVDCHRRAVSSFAIAKLNPKTPVDQLNALEKMVVDLEASLRRHPCSWLGQTTDIRAGPQGLPDSKLAP